MTVTITDVDATPIAWREAGAGDVVVLLHGLGGSRIAWDPQLLALGHDHRTVAWDLPGYGSSPPLDGPLTFPALADAVVRLLDVLAVEHAHVVGLSLGGMVALHAALAHPDRVRSLALLSTSPAFGLDGTRPEDWRAARLVLLDAGREPADYAVDAITAIAGPSISREAVAAQAAAMARISAPAMRRAVDCLVTHDVRGRLGEVTAPALVLTGELDAETPTSYGRALADGLPDATFRIVPGCGHLLPVEAPDVVNAALVEHVARVERVARVEQVSPVEDVARAEQDGAHG